MSTEESITLWKNRFKDRKLSGLNVNDWCERNHVSRYAYYYWHRKIQEIQVPDENKGLFAKIPVAAVPAIQQPDITVTDGLLITWKDFSLRVTDFRKQISSLASLVQLQFGKDPFLDTCVFIFCNKKRDSIKILRYDKNGFILADKKLLEKMKFQWLKDPEMIKEITCKQVEWLLEGLEIEQKKAHREVKINTENVCF